MAYIPLSSIVAVQSNPSVLQALVTVANFPTNPSVSGTVAVSNFPTTQNVSGSVVAFVSGLQGSSISGTVQVGNFPTTQNVSGSVVAFISGIPNVNTAGSVVAFISGTPTVVVNNGSVVAFQGTNPWVINSIVGTYAEDLAFTNADKGIMTLGVRNDAVASFVGTDLDYSPHAQDSAGRILFKPFASEEARVEGYNSVVSTSVTTLVPAAGTGLKNYITDIVLANTGATTTLVTFRSGGGTSVLGYGIAPAGGGSNMIGFNVPLRTLANETFDFQATSSSSILFATVKGFKAP